jgi:glycosyltransferase involved in cell wall biosynthesis
MSSYIFFTNIPTPYRTSFYNDLKRFGLNFKVFYYKNIEIDRSWIIDTNDMKFEYFIDTGYYKMIGRFHVHFNPNLIKKVLKDRKSEIIIGGSWNDVNVLILVILKKINIINNVFHFWTEANYMTIGASKDNYFKKILRKFVYHSSHGSQFSSGKMTEITLKKWEINFNKLIQLPNTIEEEKFIFLDEDKIKRNKTKLPTFLMPVRLLERDKGILNFFKSIGIENIRKCIFLIAGDGPDLYKILDFIQTNNLINHIILLGHCNTERIITLFKESNIFLLPSLSDPSPLSLIEALRMNLPVLVSERCGNHYEAVKDGLNGFIFNPYDSNSILNAFNKILDSRIFWETMGYESFILYNKNFDKSFVISRFINQLTLLSQNKKLE